VFEIHYDAPSTGEVELDEKSWGEDRYVSPMLAVCPVPGCSTLTMGGTCVKHDAPVTATFTRGRPHPHADETVVEAVSGV